MGCSRLVHVRDCIRNSLKISLSVIDLNNRCFTPAGLNARCVETEGGTSKGACCVFPFIYHGTQYFECTDKDIKKPWCATTSNYDIDGMWGHCLGKKMNIYMANIIFFKVYTPLQIPSPRRNS